MTATDSASAFQPVLRPRQQVELQLRQAIVSGEFSQGDRLPSEVQLADQFAVSRPTVREALRSLAEKGLITKSTGSKGGSFVEFFDHRALGGLLTERLMSTLEVGSISYAEVADYRNLLEIPAARLAARNREEAHLEQLHDVIEREKAVTIDDPQAGALNSAFHSIIAEASGNRLLSAFVSALHGITHPMTYIEWSEEVGRQGVLHHIAVTRAIKDRDADAAETAMRSHLDYLASHSRDVSAVAVAADAED